MLHVKVFGFVKYCNTGILPQKCLVSGHSAARSKRTMQTMRQNSAIGLKCVFCGWLQLRGVTGDNAPNPGKVGESIAQNVNGPDPKGAVSEVGHICNILAEAASFASCWLRPAAGIPVATFVIALWAS